MVRLGQIVAHVLPINAQAELSAYFNRFLINQTAYRCRRGGRLPCQISRQGLGQYAPPD